jgi:RNA binding exosome subunit
MSESSCSIDESIQMMCRAKHVLENIPENERNDEYNTILESINSYIDNKCNHYVVTDFIDVDVECTKMIHYCKICYKVYDTMVVDNVPKELR